MQNSVARYSLVHAAAATPGGQVPNDGRVKRDKFRGRDSLSPHVLGTGISNDGYRGSV